MIVLFDASTGEDKNFTSLFVMRVILMSMAGVYVILALKFLNRYWPSADATMKLAGKGAEAGMAISLIPGISHYQFVDTGLVLQANWGATEFLKDPNLNK